jgi:carbon storage regulator
MLCLSRLAGEEILIGENIIVKVLKVEGNRVKLGLVAPGDVNIARGELVAGDIKNFNTPQRKAG